MQSIRYIVVVFALALTDSCFADDPKKDSNPNVWNFQIARKVIASFSFGGMALAIWEDQGVGNATTASRQFYVTPITEFLPNSSQCEHNVLTGSYEVTYDIQLWNDRLQLAAIDRLKQMQIIVAPEQVQPLPFYQIRMIWNNAEKKLQNASLSTTWLNNLQQQSIRRFKISTDDKSRCELLAATMQSKPEHFTASIALQYTLSASTTATKTLTLKTEHFLNSQLVAALKNMEADAPERYLSADDANRLSLEVADNVVASQIVDGEYVPDADTVSLKDVVANSLQLVNVDVGNFSAKLWESVFWDPVYARPDKIASYLNKVLKIDQGKQTVSKSDSYNEKNEKGINFGIDKVFSFGGKSGRDKSGSASFSELQEWLRQNNYDVDIKGEFFVPKSLQLKRLNLGVLSRQENIYTKSVQMHRVDAPGTLTVTVGSKSAIESEDIKTFRARLDNLEPRVGQLEPKAAALESRFGQSEPKIAALEGRLGQLEPKAVALEGRLVLFEPKVGALEGRVGQLEPQVASAVANAAAIKAELGASIENVRVSLTKELETKYSKPTGHEN